MKKTAPQIGVYVWDPDGSLGKSMDFASLVGQCAKLKNVVRCEIAPDPFGVDFVEALAREVQEGRMDRVLWVGPIPLEMFARLRRLLAPHGLNPYLQARLDPQGQGVCSELLDPAARLRKTLTLLKMALAEARLQAPLEPVEIPAKDSALIIGGGVAGLHTAASLLDLGYETHLLEARSGVGGKTALLERFYPRICDPRCGLEIVINELTGREKFNLHSLSSLVSLEGSPGNFTARIRRQPRFVDSNLCNGCGLCQGACPKDAPSHDEWRQDIPPFPLSTGLGALAPAHRKAIHPSSPMAFPHAFVVDRALCLEGCHSCADVCPNGAVILDQAPEEESLQVGAVIVTTGWDPYPLSRLSEFGYGVFPNVIGNLEMERLLRDRAVSNLKSVAFIQCAGSRDERHLRYCSSVCCSATLKQIQSLKDRSPDAVCTVFYQDIRSTGFEEDLYRQVRALEGVRFVRGLPAGLEAGDTPDKLILRAEDTFSGKQIGLEADLLVLAGGMAPSSLAADLASAVNLPVNAHGFFESHSQCHPEESQRTGVYVGGCAREPMNVAQSIESARGVAMKAMRFLKGALTVPPRYPVVDRGKCDQCKRCVEDCPFSAMVFDEKQFPRPDLGRCRQCGNCMGVCPLGAISLSDRTIRQFAAAIETLETSFFADRNEPLVLAFLCENDAMIAAEEANRKGLPAPPNVIAMKTRCAGAVNNALIADALSLGVDGVLIGGCKDGQCHYVKGNELVRKRSADLKDKLKSMMIEPERVRFAGLEIRESREYVDLTRSFVEELRTMGPNPFKL